MMRKVIQSLWLLVAMLLVACGGGGGSPGANPNQPTLVTTAGTSQVLPTGALREFDISGGVPPYRVTAPDQAIAVATVNGKTLTIGALAPGKTTVSVLDFKGTKVDIAVQVGSSIPLYTTAPASLTIGVGPVASRTFLIGGGGAPYTVQGSDSNVALVQMVSANEWSVTGVAIGTATVKIRDAAGVEVAVALTVGSPELRISPTDLTIPVGLVGIAKISGGQPPYIVAGGIPAAVTAEIKNANELHITGKLVWKGSISVADATGKTIPVTVDINTETTEVRLSPNALTISEVDDQPIKFGVFGAVGEFCVFSSNTALLKLKGGTSCVSGTAFEIDTGTQGNRCVAADTNVEISIVDSVRSIGKATVTIKNASALSVAPTNLTLQPNSSARATIVGGSGKYILVSDNANITAAMDGKILIVRSGAATGASTVTITDENDPCLSVTLQVTVEAVPVTVPSTPVPTTSGG